MGERQDDSPSKRDAVEAATLADRVLAVHRCFPSGVAVVTTCVDDQPYGLAVNAFSSVSMEPPLVLVCVKTTAKTHDRLYGSEKIGINFLAHDQLAVANRFAKSGGDKFANLSWRANPDGVPILDGISAYLIVEIQRRVPAGSHTIFIARVTDAHAPARPPLVYFDQAFFDGAQLQPVLTHTAAG
jgi:flavin reductase (DIM6/NTAB) family NADH-FMN oxidoreductase RutF